MADVFAVWEDLAFFGAGQVGKVNFKLCGYVLKQNFSLRSIERTA